MSLRQVTWLPSSAVGRHTPETMPIKLSRGPALANFQKPFTFILSHPPANGKHNHRTPSDVFPVKAREQPRETFVPTLNKQEGMGGEKAASAWFTVTVRQKQTEGRGEKDRGACQRRRGNPGSFSSQE